MQIILVDKYLVILSCSSWFNVLHRKWCKIKYYSNYSKILWNATVPYIQKTHVHRVKVTKLPYLPSSTTSYHPRQTKEIKNLKINDNIPEYPTYLSKDGLGWIGISNPKVAQTLPLIRVRQRARVNITHPEASWSRALCPLFLSALTLSIKEHGTTTERNRGRDCSIHREEGAARRSVRLPLLLRTHTITFPRKKGGRNYVEILRRCCRCPPIERGSENEDREREREKREREKELSKDSPRLGMPADGLVIRD